MTDYAALPMRQPPQIRTTPSRRMIWYGQPRFDSRFTTQQLEEMARRKIDPKTRWVIHVKRHATDQETRDMCMSSPPVFEFDCPRVGKTKTGRIAIIAPDGAFHTVRADGWAIEENAPPRATYGREAWG